MCAVRRVYALFVYRLRDDTVSGQGEREREEAGAGAYDHDDEDECVAC